MNKKEVTAEMWLDDFCKKANYGKGITKKEAIKKLTKFGKKLEKMKKYNFKYLDKIPKLEDKIDTWANSYADEIRAGYSEKKFLGIQKQFHDKLFEILLPLYHANH